MNPWKPSFFPASRRRLKLRELLSVYRTLRRFFGHQHWWPGETAFEIIVGAILTQNTAWSNVERAIARLRAAGVLTPHALRKISTRRLARLIRPAGYFNVKAKRLKCFMDFLFQEYHGSLVRMFRESGESLRPKLLAVKGIGPETADSIFLYAGNKPFFVMDAYTRRVFSRHRIEVPQELLASIQKRIPSVNPKRGRTQKSRRSFPSARILETMDYDAWQSLLTKALPQRIPLYNDFHAQIVAVGKHFCKSGRPLCQSCPLSRFF